MAHSRLASPAATTKTLRAHGLYTRKSLGQHFLVDDNVIGRILELADLRGDEPVLEVGPGIGTLTVALAPASGSLVAVEQDTGLKPVLEETLAGLSNIKLLFADAVSVPVEELETSVGPPRALVANLPYGVAATVILRFFELVPSLESAVVMVQAEVADRIAASPGGKDFGAYTVKLGLRADTVGRFAVARSCFMPPPRVDSAVVRLERSTEEHPAEGIEAAARMAEAAFAQRRKTIRNSLRSVLGAEVGLIDEVLAAAHIDPKRRAETLSIPEYRRLGAQALKYALLP